MNIKTLIGAGAVASLLAGCGGGGDINLSPTNNTSNSNNVSNSGGGGGTANPCASYSRSGQNFQGSFDGTNCTYPNTFVSDTNPLRNDLTLTALANGGLHIFEDSLWVGEDVNSNAAAAGVRIPQDGEGPTLNVGAGSLLAFSNSVDYLRIARGSRIVAEGTATNPIVISAVGDLRDGTATEADRGLWGGVQINGNGLTNKCTDADRVATASNPHNCHVTAEGRPSTYGGNNNSESSGVLRYVQIRHAGYQVVEGDELNGLTLNAVGSGTTIEFVQTYTTLDDGFEMFGGAVNLKNVVAVNIGDDSLDYSEGYVGNIQYALLVATSGSNTCIEGDNTGSGIADNTAPYSKLRVSNMTCITSNVDRNAGTAPTSKGDSEGPTYREGAFFELYNSIITSNDPAMASNECLDISSAQTIASVETDGYSVASGNILACSEAIIGGLTNATTWWSATNALVTGASLPATVIDGLASSPTAYITAAGFTDASANPIAVTHYDASQLEDFDSYVPGVSDPAQAAPAVGSSGTSSFFENAGFIGAVSSSDDWVAGWTVGL